MRKLQLQTLPKFFNENEADPDGIRLEWEIWWGDQDEVDCFNEQLWAIREGLA